MPQRAYREPRLRALRLALEQQADPAHAAFHKAYHKSERDFYGLRAPQLVATFREIFPRREKIARDEALPLIAELWASNWAEEGAAALMLLEKITPQLDAYDLPLLKSMTHDCQGWGALDTLAICTLGPLALAQGEPVYREVRAWSDDAHMWTRRAAILVHIVPARKKALASEYAFPTFAERLHEKEFFIRKAIGWTLREISKHYSEAVAGFCTRHKPDMSGLTLREGARNLPEVLREPLLRK